MVTHQSYLNMVPDESNTPVIHVSQYDSNFTIEFFLIAVKGEFVPKYPTAVTDNVTFSVESGTTVEVRGTKKDGNGYSSEASISGKKVTVTGHEQMTAIAGKNTFEVVLKYNNKEISTANFILDVERAALDKDTVRSASVIREIIDTIDRTDEFLGAAHSISQDKADVAEMLEDAEDARDAAETAQSGAATSATAAKNWAVGPSGSGAGTDTNNAKYYSQQATSQATLAKNWAVGPNGSGNGTDTNNAKYYSQQASASASQAGQQATNAGSNATLAKNWAVGPSGSGSGTSTNNSKYYSEQATSQAMRAKNWAVGPSGSGNGTDTNNSKYYAEQAASSASSAGASASTAETKASEAAQSANLGQGYATEAQGAEQRASVNASNAETSATAADTSALKSEGYAIGEQNGSDVGSTSPYYHNNARYYADQAAASQAAVEGLLDTVLGNFATVESSTTASKAYAIGEYLVLNNILYRVTAAIASGGTITVGTNVVQTTVGDEIVNNVLCCSDPNNDGNIVITLGGGS